jgi:hypothetical protein
MRRTKWPSTRNLRLLGTMTLLSAGCSDYAPDSRPAPIATRQIVAQVVASTLAPQVGDEILVGVELVRGADIGTIASFTARIGYDAARLRVIDEFALGDGATRVANPLEGETRVAGIASSGFGGDRLFMLRATVLSPDPFRGLLVAFDELHTLDGRDVQRIVRSAAQVVPRSIR